MGRSRGLSLYLGIIKKSLHQLQDVQKQNPAHTIIGDNCNKVVYSCNQWAGSNCRIYPDFFEEQRNQRANSTGDQHSKHQGHPNTAGNCERKQDGLMFEQHNI